MVYFNTPEHKIQGWTYTNFLERQRGISEELLCQLVRCRVEMTTAAENGAHKTIALFDVDGTLTVPRKARPFLQQKLHSWLYRYLGCMCMPRTPACASHRRVMHL